MQGASPQKAAPGKESEGERTGRMDGEHRAGIATTMGEGEELGSAMQVSRAQRAPAVPKTSAGGELGFAILVPGAARLGDPPPETSLSGYLVISTL